MSEACSGEKCQSENGRKYVSDKEKAAPGILESMSKNRALGKEAGNQQSESSSRNFFWGGEIRDLTPSCLGQSTLTCDM